MRPSARGRVAKDAGVAPALVHYYFGTLDDLFVAVMRRRGEQQLERLERFLQSSQPLRALWSLSSDPAGTTLMLEFMALANHRKTIRSELAAYAERFREMQIAALSSTLEGYGFESTDVPPLAVLVLLDSIGRLIVMEESMGMRTGLQETMDLVERYLDRFEGPPEPGKRRRTLAHRRRSTTHAK